MKVIIIDGIIEQVQFGEDPAPGDFDYNKLQGLPAETKEDVTALIALLKKDFIPGPAALEIIFSKEDLDNIKKDAKEIE